MEKTTTLNLRINPDVKKNAEHVLKQLGIPLSTAVDMYLRQIAFTGGIPFSVILPQAPDSVNADEMTAAELRSEIMKGINEIESGDVVDARIAFKEFKEKYK